MNWILRIAQMNCLHKVANFGDISISFGVANINSLINIITNILNTEPDRFKTYDYNNIVKNPDLSTILNNNGQTLISAKSIEQILFAIHNYDPNSRAEINRLSKELEKRVNLRQQVLEDRYIKTKKVTSFRILQATSNYTVYALSWTSHLLGKERAYLFSGLDPNGKAFNPVRFEIQNRLGIQLLRQPKIALNEWVVSGLTPDRVPELAQVFTDLGYDASIINNVANVPYTEEEKIVSRVGKFLIVFDNVTATTRYHLAVNNQQFAGREKDLLPTFMDVVQKIFTIQDKKLSSISKKKVLKMSYSFDRVKENIAQKREKLIQPAGSYFAGANTIYLKGNFSIFQDLQKLLAIKGFDTTDLINKALKVGAELRQSGHIKVHRIVNGVLDGYYKSRSSRHRLKNNLGLYIPDVEKFQSEVSEYVIRKPGQDPYKLFPMQTEGVQWLYSRQSALLGDETGVGKCLVGSSRVSINDKYYTLSEAWNCFVDKIERISEFEEWGWSNKNLFVHSSDKSNKIVKGKIARLFRQKYTGTIICTSTSNGKSVMHTPQHRFLTPVGWHNDIKVGDYICSSSNMFKLKQSKHTLSDDLIILLAWQISEGNESISRPYLRITQKNINILKQLKNSINHLIDSVPELLNSPRPKIDILENKCSYIRWSSSAYKEYLYNLGYKWGFKSSSKVIPNFIMTLPDNKISLFLRTIFSTKSYSSSPRKYIELSSESSSLIYQISILLGRFDINCCFSSSKKYENKIKRNHYQLVISSDSVEKYMNTIGLDYKPNNYRDQQQKKNPNKTKKVISHLLEPFCRQYQIPYRHLGLNKQGYITGETHPTNEVISNIIEHLNIIKSKKILAQYQQLKMSKWTRSIQKYESIDCSNIEELINSLQEIVDNDLHYERVTSIRKIEWDDYIYDLSVENHHNYIAENLICHNTEQLIVAADMRTKKQNLWDKNLATGKIAIFTLASVVNQFAMRILQVLGLPSNDQFLRSPESPVKLRIEDMNHPNAKWFVSSYGKVNVLTQKQQERKMGDTEEAADANEIIDSNISGTKIQRETQVKEFMKQFRLQNFDVLILDESHMVKNSTSNTSKNIELLGKTVPFKWGASATVSANKPPDLHRQLLAVGNSMGFMNASNFNKQYTGMKTKKIQGQEREYLADPSSARNFLNFTREEYKGFDKLDLVGKQDIVRQLAEEYLRPIVNKQIESITDLHAMLILLDVYQRKTKKQVRPEIPNHYRYPELLQTDEALRFRLTESVNHRLENMASDGQDAESNLTRLTAYRIEMALQKVPQSVNKALSIIRQNQKVLIFTCFKEPAKALETELRARLQPYRMEVYMAMGESTTKFEMIEEFRNPNSPIKAFILGVLSSGTGIDLPNIVNNVIVNDISWTPKDADQVEGRAFRINSMNPVTTYYMVLNNTPDAVIYQTVQKKRDIAKRIQDIDEKYAEKIRTNKSTTKELKEAQQEHWNLVREQLIAETAVQHFWAEQQKMLTSRSRHLSNWFQKLVK